MRRACVVLTALACGQPSADDEAGFAEEFAARWCEREEECALGEFERSYTSRDDCREEKADDEHLVPRWDQGCDLDEGGADDCLAYLRTTDCEGWEKKEIDLACDATCG